MQPYLFPYIGYWQLISTVDAFVIYDNVKYTKQGWINRNRILVGRKDYLFTVPLKKDSDSLDVCQRRLAESFAQDSASLVSRIESAYGNASNFQDTIELVSRCFRFDDPNLFNFIYYSVTQVCEYLGISTPIVKSSTISTGNGLKKEHRVMAICKALGATEYINPIGGMELYNREEFKLEGLNLVFLKSKDISYKQFDNEFVPWLSIIDVMMFNPKDRISEMLNEFDLV